MKSLILIIKQISNSKLTKQKVLKNVHYGETYSSKFNK